MKEPRHIRDLSSIFGKGPEGPLLWEFYLCLATNWGNSKIVEFSNFPQRVSRITWSHIFLYHLTQHWKKEHPSERKLNNYWKLLKFIFWLGIILSNWEKMRVFCIGTGAHKRPLRYTEKIPAHRRKDYLFAFFLISPDYHLDCQLVRIAVSHVYVFKCLI